MATKRAVTKKAAAKNVLPARKAATSRSPASAAAAPNMLALIRGINVGTAKRVSMAELKAEIERLGYTSVRTLLNSGNVVFAAQDDPAKAAAKIEKILAADLGVPARVVVLTADEVATIVAENKLPHARHGNPSRLMVSVLFAAADATKLAPLGKQKWGRDAFALGSRAAYVWCETSSLDSEVQAAVLKALKDGVTTRNWATILKLHGLLSLDA